MTSSDRLPRDPIERTASLVLRALPSSRDRLPACLPAEACEVILDARNVRAQTYASMEDLTDRCRTLAEDIEQVGAVVHLVDVEDEISMVNYLESTSRTLVAGVLSEQAEIIRADELVDEVRRIPLAAGGRLR